MNRLFLVTCCFLFSTLAVGQNCPLDAPVPVPDFDTVKINLEVFDVVNDDLSAPDQGVCSIDIDFNCDEIGGLEIWLVSPGGDTVQLAGPVVNTGTFGTLFSNWDITFLNDTITPTAQPDFPYDQRFNNLSNNFAAGSYSGSYFPAFGSLEHFNSGPVNGQWQLILHMEPNFILTDGTRLNDIHINFCDRRGYFCCFAESGQLADSDPVVACEGDATLASVDLGINFTADPADSTVYDYTYIVTQGGNIIGYDSMPDLRTYPAGDYELTGFSYQRDQRDSFPLPDATYMLDTLRTNLMSDLPPFCGMMTDSSKNIRILAQPDTTFLGVQTICLGDSLVIEGQVLDSAGLYQVAGTAANGCDSIIQVELILEAPVRDTILESTCDNNPFLSSTGATLNDTGFYSFSYPRASGCDSVVVVDFRRYNIIPVISPSATTITCRDSVITLDGTGTTTGYGSFTYRWEAPPFGQVISTDSIVQISNPGNYTVQLRHEAGCPPVQTSILIGEDTTSPSATVNPAFDLTCSEPQIRLTGQVISGSGAYSYNWTSSNGRIVADTTTLNPLIDSTGTYDLILTDEGNGCRDTASVLVAIDTVAPVVTIQGDSLITCAASTSQLTAVTAVPGNYSFAWFDGQGVAIPGGNTNAVTVSVADTFEVVVTNLDNGCASSALFMTGVDTIRPEAIIETPPVLNCQLREFDLDGSGSQFLTDVIPVWTASNGGNIVAGDSSLFPSVNAAGDYQLLLTNQRNGCTNSAVITVQDTTQILLASVVQDDTLTCGRQETILRATGSSTGTNIQYTWTDLDHGTFSGTVADEVTISQPGRYQLLVQDTFTKCLEVTTYTTLVDTIAPLALTGPTAQLDCNTPVVSLGDAASSQNGNLVYSWQGPCLLTRADSIQVAADCAGIYTLMVFDQNNSCSTSTNVEVSRDTTNPTAIIADSVEIDCGTGEAFLDGSASSGGTLEWYFEGNSLNTNEDSLLVVNPGLYTLRVFNAALQCEDEKDVVVISDCKPTAIIAPADSLECTNLQVQLDASGSEGVALAYTWSGPGGECFVNGDSTSASVMITCPGRYQVIVTNTVVNESDTATVEVLDNISYPVAEAGADIDLTCEMPLVNRSAFNPGNPGGTVYRWNTSFGLTLSNQPDFDFEAGGTYILEVENVSNNCISRDTILVTEPDLPNFEIRAPEVLNCADSSVVLDPLFFTSEDHLAFFWEGLEGQALQQPELRTIEVSEPGLFRLTATDTTTMCRFTDSILVELDRMIPEVNAGLDTILACRYSSLSLKGEVGAPTGSYEYLWLSDQNSDIVSGKNTLEPIVSDTGLFQLVVLDLNNGCIGTDTVEVLPPPSLPDISSLSDTAFNCTISSIRLVSPVPDTAAYDLIWTGFTDAGVGIDSMPGFDFLAEATGSYTLTIRDKATGCVDDRTIRVDIDTIAPVFSIQVPEILTCMRTEVTLGLTDSLDQTQFSFSWMNDMNAPLGNETSLLVDQAGTYTLIVTDMNNGCQTERAVQVMEDIELPTLQLSTPGQLTCSQDTVQISATAEATTRAKWSGPAGGIIGSGDLFEISAILPGTYTVEVLDTLTGCSIQDSVLVMEDRSAPELSLDTANLIIGCIQTSVTIDASQVITSGGQAPVYQWTGSSFNSNQSIVVIDEPQILSLQLTDTQNDCRSDYAIEVKQDQEQPRFDLVADGTLGCGKASVQIEANFLMDAADYQLDWYAGSVELSQNQIIISVQDTGVYTLISTNPENGCTFEDSILVQLNPGIPEVTVDVDTVLDCEIDQVALAAKVSNYSVGELTYIWETDNGNIVGPVNGSSIFAGEQGIYSVEVRHEPSNCSNTAQASVVRLGRRIEGLGISLTPDNCDADGGGTLAISSVEGGTAPFLYNFNGGGFSDASRIAVESAGTYSLEIEDIDGCRWDTVVTFSLEDLPLVNLGPDTTIREGDSIELEVVILHDNYTTLNWISNNTNLASDITSLTVKPNQSSAYTVRTTTAEGCVFEDVIWVFVEEAPVAYLPTAFSPNDDGFNDHFIPGFTDQVLRIRQFYVYDRWGNIVHAINNALTDDLNAAWDGTFRNQPLPSAVYVYWMEVEMKNGEVKQLKGDVLLVR